MTLFTVRLLSSTLSKEVSVLAHPPTPVEVRQLQSSGELEVSWSDGLVRRFKDLDLRRACRCTICRQTLARQGLIQCAENIRILSIAPVGSYAIQVRFDDGHDRGIFPWAYLRHLGRET